MCSVNTKVIHGQLQNLIQYITVTQLTPQIVTKIVYLPSPVTILNPMTQLIPSNYATQDQIRTPKTLEPVKSPETQQSILPTFVMQSMATSFPQTIMQQSIPPVISMISSQLQNSLVSASHINTQASKFEPDPSLTTNIISAVSKIDTIFSFPTFQYTTTPTFTFPTQTTTTTPYSTETKTTRTTPSTLTSSTTTEFSITLPPTGTETASALRIVPNQESSLLYLAGLLGITASTFLFYIF
ncbi:13857_t:CDS:2 [Ambispora leptoticha]|uniref:13857_t:CDS:1 n=1 Tax=Ambispora leptoticha TaxID=144679 RepID=A0A9N8YQS3_9GLOM|nr:13857_t:CDS:2 [Ambispora leptoticha]